VAPVLVVLAETAVLAARRRVAPVLVVLAEAAVQEA
jgi:hypothetical protein